MNVAEATGAALEAEPRLDERTVADALTAVAAHDPDGDRLTREALDGKLDAAETAESDTEDAERALESAYGAAEDAREVFEADLEGSELPVDWGTVQATLLEHRKQLRAA